MKKATKLALVLPGAVSLGAYEAGAVYELLLVFGLLGDQCPFALDLIVGTSAGALTGALAAYSIARRESALRLHEAWVHGLALASLLQQESRERGALSGSSVMKTAERYLDATRVARAGRAIRLVVTVTDLNGKWYQIRPTPESSSLDALNFAEQKCFDLSPTTSRRGWQSVRDAACASAAFPGAFPAVPLTDDDGVTHWYADGAIANHRLLEIAIDAAHELDQEPLSQRLMLLIEPNPMHRPEKESKDPPEPTWLDAIMRSALTVPFHDQIYDDLRRVARINQRVRLATDLDHLLQKWVATLDNDLCLRMIDEMNPLYGQAMRYHGSKTLPVWVQQEQTHMKRSTPHASPGELSPRQSQLYDKCRFLIYTAAGLLDKTEIRVDLIAPEGGRTELAGEFWGHFGGLLRPTFREHDFRMGRQGARVWLRKQGIDYELDDQGYETDPALGQMALGQVSTWEKLRIGTRLVLNGYRAATASNPKIKTSTTK